jgi:hypothetical protein
VAWSTSRWGRALLGMMSIVLVFLLSALVAYFAGSLVNREPPPTSDRGPTTVEETTQVPRAENKPEPKTLEKTTEQPPPEQTTPQMDVYDAST